MILEGRVLEFDVGYLPAHDRHFFLMAAIGYPAKVIQDSPRRLKNLFGVFTYLGAGIRNALNLDEVRVFIEDQDEAVHEYEGNTILLSNIGKIGDINLKVTPDTSAHDGLFDVTVISSRSLWDLLLVLFRMLTWRHRPTQRLHHFQATQGGHRHRSAGRGADRRRAPGRDAAGGRGPARGGEVHRR